MWKFWETCLLPPSVLSSWRSWELIHKKVYFITDYLVANVFPKLWRNSIRGSNTEMLKYFKVIIQVPQLSQNKIYFSKKIMLMKYASWFCSTKKEQIGWQDRDISGKFVVWLCAICSYKLPNHSNRFNTSFVILL